MKMNQKYLVTAAGGNGTAICILDKLLSRESYATFGKKLGKDFESDGAEQAGFLIPSQSHLEMAGGEFCGNASRSAAVLLSEFNGKSNFDFTVSGFEGQVSAKVEKSGDRSYFVSCFFPGLPTDRREVVLSTGQTVDVVDLGGIVHILLSEDFDDNPEVYEKIHRNIVTELGLQERGAVGVIWYEQDGNGVKIKPVVWVKEVDTFFYEESCGSGSIAAGKITGQSGIIQPTGESIEVVITDDGVTLTSYMEVTHVRN